MAVKTHDFFVFYYEEDDVAQRFAEYFVNRWEKEFNLQGLYYHRDAVIGKDVFSQLQDSIERSKITVVVFTKKFGSHDNGFNKYANLAAFTHLLDKISTTPCYVPVGVGITEDEFPSCIRNVLAVAKFKEYDWDQEVQIWRRLDNVLRDNDLLTEEQMKKLGSKHKRYVPPAERLVSDKLLHDHVASRICHEYMTLGIELGIPHERLVQIKKTDSDPLNYNLKMLVTWREESERRGLTEQQTLDMLLNALKEVERMDLHQEVLLYREEFRRKQKKREEEEKEALARQAAEEARRVQQEEERKEALARQAAEEARRVQQEEERKEVLAREAAEEARKVQQQEKQKNQRNRKLQQNSTFGPGTSGNSTSVPATSSPATSGSANIDAPRGETSGTPQRLNDNANPPHSINSDQTSVKKPVGGGQYRGYVSLHDGPAPTPATLVPRLNLSDPDENQVVLAEPVFPREQVVPTAVIAPNVQEADANQNQDGTKTNNKPEGWGVPQHVPTWMLPVAIAITAAITAFLYSRLNGR